MKDNQNNTIEIHYQNSIPKNIFENLGEIANKNQVTINIRETPTYENLDGDTVDVIIEVANIFLGGIIFDLSKTIWKQFRDYYSNKKTPPQKDVNCIRLIFKLSNEKEIEFQLEEDVSTEQIEVIMGKIDTYLKNTNELKSVLNNPNYVSVASSKPKIRMKYNSQTGKWEPVNFQELKKYFEEGLEKAQNKYLC